MIRTKFIVGFLGVFGFFGLLPTVHAETLTLRHDHHLFTLDSAKYPSWRGTTEEWFWSGEKVEPLAEWKVDGDSVPALPAGVTKNAKVGWNRSAIAATVEKVIGTSFEREAGRVKISRDEKGEIVFDGVGLTGRKIDAGAAADLIVAALERGVAEIELPVAETQPVIIVEDDDLAAQGIQEVVTVGESNFAGSPVNRRHNIQVGLNRFNGHLIPKGKSFSFNEVLGRVDGSTGYKKELVIKGDRTEPDYGGGLCQISSTAYRGIWEYGFPIEKRRNHSYVVQYYSPAGTDATVYPGAVDMVFTNDSPGALLIQTHQQNDKAYFIYYGTRDSRTAEVYGPFVLSRSEPPPDKEEFTTDLPPGERKKLNSRVPGLKALWFRKTVDTGGHEQTQSFFSNYEARPLFYAVGVDPASLSETGESSSSVSSSVVSSEPAVIELPRRPPSRR